MASKGGDFVLLFCLPPGNTERVVARWWCLVAFIKASDLLHWAMRVVLHRRTAMAIKMASNGGAFVCRCRLF
jgi:hypothetical protein